MNNIKRNLTGFDPSDILFHKKLQKLEFYYVPSNGELSVSFKAFLTEYSDIFASNWKKDDVYGRMDPIATFGGTQRRITVAWAIPAFSREDSVRNVAKVATLINMLYPVYDNHQGAGQINTAPLLKLKFGNLICDSSSGPSLDSPGDARSSGLLGWLDGVTFTPDLEAGFYDPGMHELVGQTQKPTDEINSLGELYPMLLNLNCTFNVLHQHKLGWKKEKNSIGPNHKTATGFPYGIENEFLSDSIMNEPFTPSDLGQKNCDSTSYKPSGLGPITDPQCSQPQGLDPSNDAYRAAQLKILGTLADMGTGMMD
jgi:hypothetical protein